MPIIYRVFFAGILVGGIFYAGAYYNSRVNKPDLHCLYMQSMETTDQPLVVFLHGVMGAKLRDTRAGKELWPGSLHRGIRDRRQRGGHAENNTEVPINIDW